MGLFSKKNKDNADQANANNGGKVTLENGEALDVSTVVDCIGDSCPRPQLMTKSAIGKANAGDIIEVDVDNPTSMEALPPIIKESGGTHLGTVRQPRHWQVVLRVN